MAKVATWAPEIGDDLDIIWWQWWKVAVVSNWRSTTNAQNGVHVWYCWLM